MKASEMQAARKAAKREQAVKKYARDNIGNQRADRNKLANIAVIQVQNKLSLRSGAPQDLDSKLTENIKNLMHYQVRVVACIYSDSDLSKTTNEAQAAIEQLQESDDLSPNQRREILKPVLRLTEYQEAYGEIIPERTVSKIGLYCASVQIALYTASLYNRKKRYIQALFDIINGESLRAIAKKINEKENVLREEVLNAAWHFFRVAECNSAVQPVSSIPELRQDGYKVLADFDRLKDFIQTAMQKILIPFEQNTGISLINYNQFRKDLVQAEII